MQRQAVEVAEEAMSKFQVEKDIAQYIKKEVRRHTGLFLQGKMLGRYSTLSTMTDKRVYQFDSRAGATWHCIVGRNFGSFVTHGMLRQDPRRRSMR